MSIEKNKLKLSHLHLFLIYYYYLKYSVILLSKILEVYNVINNIRTPITINSDKNYI